MAVLLEACLYNFSDIDLAKELSLKEVPTTQPAPIPSPELQFLGVSSTHAASSSSGMDTAPLTLSMPCQGAAAGHGGGGTSLLNFLPNTATAGSSCADRSSPSNGGPACEEDQQGWEDEELARALSLSLLDQQAQQGQQERDSKCICYLLSGLHAQLCFPSCCSW